MSWQICVSDDEEEDSAKRDTIVEMTIQSPAFDSGDLIPIEFSCEGGDYSPPLFFENIPDEAKSLVLICDDPDAPGGVFNHWTAYNIPLDINRLDKQISKLKKPELLRDSLKMSFDQGVNDFGKYGYGGPCPPKGSIHRYYFRLYALDTVIVASDDESKTKLSAKHVREKMAGHILAEAALMGRFGR
jgi:Raf kinase inhibitor-like YbhB/YbcL family protein